MDRKKKDVTAAILFLSFVASMFGMCIYGFVAGDPQKMLNPYDGKNNFCGLDPGFEEYPMLYLSDLGLEDPELIFKSGVCVKECPPRSNKKVTLETPSGGIEVETTYKSKIVLQYCFPDFAGDTKSPHIKHWKRALERFLDNPAGANFTDMYLSSRAIYLSMFLAPLYILFFVLLLSKFAHYIAWMVIIFVQLGLFAASYFFMTDFLMSSRRSHARM